MRLSRRFVPACGVSEDARGNGPVLCGRSTRTPTGSSISRVGRGRSVAPLVLVTVAGMWQLLSDRLDAPPGTVFDEVGYIPFEQDAANLFFQPVSSRSLILTSNLPFAR